MAKKAKKSKYTEEAFREAAINCMRMSFARYSPKHKEVIARCRVETTKYNKDGCVSKRDQVDYRCENCADLVKKLDVDHKDPVIPVDKTSTDYNMQEIYDRINCDNSNLWGLCVDKCHKDKSEKERKLRAFYRKQRKEGLK